MSKSQHRNFDWKHLLMTQVNYFCDCEQRTIVDLSDPKHFEHENVDVDNMVIKLKYLMIEKQKTVSSGNICFMVILSEMSNDSGNERFTNSILKCIEDLTLEPVPIGIVVIRDTDLLTLQLYDNY